MSTWNKYLEKILDVLWILITNTFNKVDFLESIWKEFLIHWTCCVSLGFHWHTGGLDGHLIPDYTKSQWHWWTIFSHSGAGSVRSKILYFESISRLVVGSGCVSAWPSPGFLLATGWRRLSSLLLARLRWWVAAVAGPRGGVSRVVHCSVQAALLSHRSTPVTSTCSSICIKSHIHDSLQSWTLFKLTLSCRE